MTIDLCAAGTRVIRTAAIAALVLATLLLATPVAAHAAGTTTTSTLAEGTGMTAAPSVRVRTFQRALRRRGYDLGPAGVDGRFGPRTAAAVRRFQARKGLAVDGIVGPSTRRSLGLSRVAGRRAKEPARQSRSRPRRHSPAQTGDGASARPAPSPSTAAQTPSPTPTTAPAPSTPAGPGSGAAQPTTAAPDHARTTWGVPLAIGTIGMLLLVLAVPLFWDPHRPRRQRRAPRAATAAESGRGKARPGRTAATASIAATPAPSRGATTGCNRRGDTKRPARRPPGGAAAAGRTEQKASSAVNGNGRPPLAPGDPVLGYVRVPKDRRAASIRAIRMTCDGAGWSLVDIVCDRANGTSRQAPALKVVLERIDAGEVKGLVVGHDGHAGDSHDGGAALGLPSLPGRDFALHDLEVDTEGCDIALVTLNGRRSLVGKRAVG